MALFTGDRFRWGCTVHVRRQMPSPAPVLAERIAEQALAWTGGTPLAQLTIVVETPEVYQGRRANEVNLQGLFALIEAVSLRAKPTPLVEISPPWEWKGNISKRATKIRVRRRLHDFELDGMFDQSEDTFDAIGLGLWYTRRVERGLVLLGR
jgi:hypothetical protein